MSEAAPPRRDGQRAELAALADAFGPVAELVDEVLPVLAPAAAPVPLLDMLALPAVSLRWQAASAAAATMASANP